jgi:hypothetical protein
MTPMTDLSTTQDGAPLPNRGVARDRNPRERGLRPLSSSRWRQRSQ